VELHKSDSGDTPQQFLQRFAATHDVTVIDSTERVPSLYPELEFMSDVQRSAAVNEFRSRGQQWAFMKTKNPCCS
jgi:hypothetical protein